MMGRLVPQSTKEVKEDKMTEQEINKAIGEIAEYYGAKKQSLHTCEECCAELIQTVDKLTRGESPARILSLVEEIADARIMMSQLMHLYGISEAEISNQIEEKLKKQLEGIRKTRA